jgi:paraquat-inducible protein B
MAEEFVTRDQHRADLTELHLEIASTLANLDKNTEVLIHGLRAIDSKVEKNISDLKMTIQSLEQKGQQNFTLLHGEIQRLEQRSQQDINNLRQDSREARNTTTRQMWTMITLVVAIVAGGVIKLVFFP